MSVRARRPAFSGSRTTTAGVVLATTALVAGCTAVANDSGPSDDPSTGASPTAQEKTESDARLSTNLPRRKKASVGVDTLLSVKAADGRLRKVSLKDTTNAGVVKGAMKKDDTSWVAGDRLEPGTKYRLVAVAEDADGLRKRLDRTFRTDDLTLDEQTYPSMAPLDGETVGVGMPVIVSFDRPVTDRAEIERNMSVDTKPAQKGTWHWLSDNEVHWRPKTYWKPGSKVTVHADINGVNAGNGIYGQENRESSFTVGDALIMKIDVARHEMQVRRNGALLRTLPISAGKPGFTTRSGVKVIIEKFREKTMDAATTGIDEDDPEYYNIDNVEYAQRVTYSGEFLHAAPWSVGSQGSANVSHGCVGMSTADAGWLYSQTRRGDVVDVTGSDRRMEATNGYGDWNVSWADYRAASALR